MLTDGELCELFTHDNSGTMQSVQRIETKKMVVDKKLIVRRKRRKCYTALIFLPGSLVCISFGTMIGWPSPSYPILLALDAPIPITIDQSAMIAGMLMNGFVLGTPFSGCDCLGSKLGVIVGAAVIFSGWLLMIGAMNIIELCISRFLVGIGAGLGLGKLKVYLKEICNEKDGIILQKLLIVFVNIGIVISFSVGPFVTYRMLSVIATVIPGLAFLSFIVVPNTPHNLYKHQKITTAVIFLQNLHGKECVDDEIDNIKKSIERKADSKSFIQILRNSYARRAYIILTFLMTIQQFAGGPSLIVYSQIIYTEFNMFFPSICSIVYSIIYLIASGIGVKYTPNFNRKPILLISLLLCMITSAIHVYFSYFKPINIYYAIIPFITTLIFCLSHTAGVSVVTQLVINDIFPLNSRSTMTYYWNMYTAFLAVIVTKIFQVLYDRYGMFASFSLFTSVNIFGFFVVLLCLTETKGKLDRRRRT